MNDAITNAVNAALAQSQKAVATIAAENTTTQVAMPLAGKARSLVEAIESAGTSCDLYLQVDKNGINIDKEDTTPFESLSVSLRLADIKSIYGIRYTSAGITQYGRSADGIRETRTGQPWGHFCDKARSLDPKASPYDAFEFVVTLQKEVTTKKGVIKVGTTLGHTTSITNYRPFAAWVGEMLSAAPMDARLNVLLTHKRMEKNNNKWGMIIPSLVN